jgi:putative ABC transport system permease protein
VHPFKYEFFDQELAATNQALLDVVSVLGFLAFLAVTISCLGLLGMATYVTERRRREVALRKVLGAADAGIALLLSREFLKMLALAVALGAPLTYGINTLWLQNFPNRVPFGVGTLLLGTGMLLVLGLLTISSQTLRAARSKPVDSLRTE